LGGLTRPKIKKNFYIATLEGTGMLGESTREIENISRGHTFGNFVTIRPEASMQDITVARLQRTRVQTPLSPSFKCNVQYCVRVSVWIVKFIPCSTLMRRGS
jgi:hypothetical protein